MSANLHIPNATPEENRHWYVIHTKPRQELRALENLQQQSFEVYLPLVKSEKLQRGKLVTIEEPLFKRYLFVCFNAELSPWHVIRNTFGVSELVRMGGQLARVPVAIIDRLKQFETTPQALFNNGETLRVTDGPFQNLEVVFDMQDGDSRAIVLIELLNKTQRVAVNLNSLVR
jgi:transcriptional antiterminator RfaH